MDKIEKLIESTREELNCLIRQKEIITDDNEILELSIKLDTLINQYLYTHKQVFNKNSNS
ncbi:aspartyl-phosphate phosphatase Spo0E family protein [Clostridium kluyveri]|uniref:aspartyl-phosphate phosphatase Spo0E family protein n=1 Tax=Clostridium kluyveri TaxID=1534 RepID=UPI0022454BAA|nr:aspartyl-phosphate phosphatase Spo0E family protein [Clostridium kluyveri]UZQ52426.1 aspartyl-phosphate phosphatase Spo0E family protein [Clostridium kluyveri]